MTGLPTFDVQVLSSTTIFPECRSGEPTTIPLSIIDSTVSWFFRCAAIWYFDPPTDPNRLNPISSDHLSTALSKTLNSYPQWCGRLSYANYKPDSGHNSRYRRVQVTYNGPTDVGVPFVNAVSPKNLVDFLPDTEFRKTSMKAWDGSQLPSQGLYPTVEMSLNNERVPLDAPNLVLQLTTFACGSSAISISITHGLADAQSLSQFAKDFSSVSSALASSTSLPILAPIFNPGLLDAYAAGDIDLEKPDPVIQEQARRLPLHRYDNYIGTPEAKLPADLNTVAHLPLSKSTPIPWDEWDFKSPVAHRVFHFSAAEVTKIYSLASSSTNFEATRISKLDALLSHIWTLINTARKLPPQTTTYLDLSLGLRPRVEPPLPPSFLGSPIISAAVAMSTPASLDVAQSLSETAVKIRSSLQEFKPSAIAAILHDSAFEVSPQRLWRCFLGRKHVLLTPWLHLGLDEVDFGGPSKGAGKLKHIAPIMPSCDGLVVVLESVGESKAGHWSRNGVDVSISLESKAMDNLLTDRSLWAAGSA